MAIDVMSLHRGGIVAPHMEAARSAPRISLLCVQIGVVQMTIVVTFQDIILVFTKAVLENVK